MIVVISFCVKSLGRASKGACATPLADYLSFVEGCVSEMRFVLPVTDQTCVGQVLAQARTTARCQNHRQQ
jgi:hypothetical protein